MIFKTIVASESNNNCIDSNAISREEEEIYSDRSDTNTVDEECNSISLVPEWKDDDDDTFDIETCHIHRIPSTLEIVLPERKTSPANANATVTATATTAGNVVESREPHGSPSSVSYTDDDSSRNSPIEMIVEGGFLPPPIAFSTKNHPSEGNAVPHHHHHHQVPIETTKTKERGSFRRRLNSAATDIGSFHHHLSSDSQSSLSPSLPSVLLSRNRNSSSTFDRSRQRFVMILGAFLLVLLSTQEDFKNSRQFYREQDRHLSADFREEIAFPLTSTQKEENKFSETTGGTKDGSRRTGEETNGMVTNHPGVGNKPSLPKFYFPKVDPYSSSSSNNDNNDNTVRGSASAGRPGSNLVMARSPPARPLFVPDAPLPGGGFKKPLERFVYDSQTREEIIQEQRRRRYDDSSSSSPFLLSSFWTSWIATLALVSMVVDTGWKEYRRYRLSTISSSRDE